MIPTSSFFKISQALKVSNATILLRKHINYCQEHGFFLTFASAERVTKRRKSKTSVWRPVNLPSSSTEGSLIKEANIHSEVLPVRPQLDSNADAGGQEDHHEVSWATADFGQDTVKHTKNSKSVSLGSNSLNNDTGAAASEKSTLPQEIAVTYYPRKSKSPEHISRGPTQVETIDDLGTSLSDNPAAELHYSTSIEVDASLVGFIKGKGGFTQKKIEEEAGVRILLPSSKEDLEVTVQGASVEDVTRAMERIKALLDEAVKSPRLDYSHFVSLPLAIYPSLVDKLVNFQNSILGVSTCQVDGDIENDQNEDFSEEEEDKICTLAEGSTVSVNLKVQDDNEHVKVVMDDLHTGKNTTQVANSGLSDLRIDQSIFIKPKTFHLTVLMLKLWNKDRVATAIDVLQKVSSSVWDALEGRPISIRLKGLTCMKGSPSIAGVLYAPVEVIDGEERLLRACQVIIDAYDEAGLVIEKDNRKLKLHATVMNVRHRKGKNSRRHDSFDARSIIKQYGSEDWGEYLIREAHLSQRFAYDDNGYYHCCALIPFPEILEGTAMSADAIEP
ncbi:uncharacterized protein LOC116258508 isoform X2 [Nymphaea colorata]|uniref:uncharacterized protein LOC116258508 isoform X2 n=1 Tax=Nymphaea colorata TaxID=210225 RepID=UPI00214F4D93|nr:uncharacterized protein LOC116258508 isoform X2 [Nymphaea colorata]